MKFPRISEALLPLAVAITGTSELGCDQIIDGNKNGFGAMVKKGKDVVGDNAVADIVTNFRENFPASQIQPIPQNEFAQEGRDQISTLNSENVFQLMDEALNEQFFRHDTYKDAKFSLQELLTAEEVLDEDGNKTFIFQLKPDFNDALEKAIQSNQVAIDYEESGQIGEEKRLRITLKDLKSPKHYTIEVGWYGAMYVRISQQEGVITIDDQDIFFYDTDVQVLDYGKQSWNSIVASDSYIPGKNGAHDSVKLLLSTDGQVVKIRKNYLDTDNDLHEMTTEFYSSANPAQRTSVQDIPALKAMLSSLQSSKMVVDVFEEFGEDIERKPIFDCSGITSEEEFRSLATLMPKRIDSYINLLRACSGWEVNDQNQISPAYQTLTTVKPDYLDVIQYTRHAMRYMGGGQAPALWIYRTYEYDKSEGIFDNASVIETEVCVNIENPNLILGDNAGTEGESTNAFTKSKCVNGFGHVSTWNNEKLAQEVEGSNPRSETLNFDFFW